LFGTSFSAFVQRADAKNHSLSFLIGPPKPGLKSYTVFKAPGCVVRPRQKKLSAGVQAPLASREPLE
jgi:hypothetical protein